MSEFENFSPISADDTTTPEVQGHKPEQVGGITLANMSFDEALYVEAQKLNKDKKDVISNEKTIEKEEQIKARVSHMAANLEDQGSKIEETRNLLNTRDLPPLHEDQARLIMKTLESNQDIDLKTSVVHEVATPHSFEKINASELALVAVKMRHFDHEKEMYDLSKANELEEKFYFASLAALVDVYDQGGISVPIPAFRDLSAVEMKVLHNQFIGLIEEKCPQINLQSNYKISDLKRICRDFLKAMNFMREKEGTDLFSKLSFSGRAKENHSIEGQMDLFDLFEQFRDGKLDDLQ